MSAAEALKRLDTPFVDTRRAERRDVRLASLDELGREIDRIVAASAPDGEGLRVTGNWSAGQIFSHLARTIDRSIDGFGAVPTSEIEVPRGLAGIAARARRARAGEDEARIKAALVEREWQAGVDLPSVGLPGQTDPPEQVWTPHGADHLRGAIRRIRDKHQMDKPSPTAGRLTREEWERFHLRHAAWHLGFVVLGERR